MAEIENPTAVDGVNEVRSQLMRRIAIAGVIIVSLVAGLAAFDASNVGDAPTPVAAVAVAPSADTKPDTPAEPKPEAKVEPTAEAQVEPATAPVPPPVANATEMTTDSKAVESSTAHSATQTSKRDAPEKNAKPISAPPVAATQTPPKKAAVPTLAESTSSPEAPPLREVPRALTKPAMAQTVSTKPSTVAPVSPPEPAKALNASAPVRPFTQTAVDSSRHYVLQMGVFSNVANAQDLYAKLQKAGIPSQIEARVHVGPFANRAEAEAAQKKLSELGLDGGMLVTSRK